MTHTNMQDRNMDALKEAVDEYYSDGNDRELEKHMRQQIAMKRSDDRLWLAVMAMQALIEQGFSDVWQIAYQSSDMADTMLEVADGQVKG
jgi:hypothetical protein